MDRVAPLVIFLGALGLWAAAYSPASPSQYEISHYGEIGRHIATHGTFRTQLLRGVTLAYFREAHIVPDQGWPVSERFWLHAYWVGLLMKLIGHDLMVVSLATGLDYACLGLFSYLLARRLFGTAAAWLAAGVFLLGLGPIRQSLWAFPDPTAAVALMAVHWCFLKWWERPTRAPQPIALAVGVLAGLAQMARYNAFIFFPAYLGLTAWLAGRARWAAVTLCLAGFVVGSLPASLYNLRHFGNPLGPETFTNLPLTMGATNQDGWVEYRLHRRAELRGHLDLLAHKMLWNAQAMSQELFSLWQFQFVIPFFVAGLFLPLSLPARRFLALTGGLFVLQLLIWLAFRFETGGRHYFWFAPVVAAYSAGALLALVARLTPPMRRVVVAGVLLAHAGLSLAWLVFQRRAPWDENYAEIGRRMAPRDWIVAHYPHNLVWALGRTTVELTPALDDFYRMAADYPQIGWVYLPPELTREAADAAPYAAWLALKERRRPPEGWRLVRAFPNGGVLFSRSVAPGTPGAKGRT